MQKRPCGEGKARLTCGSVECPHGLQVWGLQVLVGLLGFFVGQFGSSCVFGVVGFLLVLFFFFSLFGVLFVYFLYAWGGYAFYKTYLITYKKKKKKKEKRKKEKRIINFRYKLLYRALHYCFIPRCGLTNLAQNILSQKVECMVQWIMMQTLATSEVSVALSVLPKHILRLYRCMYTTALIGLISSIEEDNAN